MKMQGRRSKNNKERFTMKRKVFLVLFILILIPLLYKGITPLINGSKILYSNMSYKG